MEPIEYCHELVRKSKSNFYWSIFFLSKHKKNAMLALYAYCRQLDDIVDSHENIEIAAAKLNWWRKEVDRLFAKQPTHPITKVLVNYLDLYAFEKKWFLELIYGMQMDLEPKFYQTYQDLDLYCYRAASTVGLLSANVFGSNKNYIFSSNPNNQKFAINLGKCLQLINIIRDLGEDLRLGRIYIPQEDLAKFNIKPQDIFNRTVNQTNLAKLLAFEAGRAKDFYKLALSTIDPNDLSKQRFSLAMANTYLKLLSLLEQENYDVLNQKISLPPLRKILISLNTLIFNPKYI